MANVSTIDRIFRLMLAAVFIELGYFWLGGMPQIAAYLAGTILLATAALGFCPAYRIAGFSSTGIPANRTVQIAAALLLIAVIVAGSYASGFFTRKLFLEDFNAMNNYYKQTLFLTGKNEREQAIANYERLIPAYSRFQDKYSTYRPYALKGDAQLGEDLGRVKEMLSGVDAMVRSGDLHQAHLALEKVRPVFQDMFKRNGFSMLAVALVDFHDAMELVLDAAAARDPAAIVALYPQASAKLQLVEAETNDAEIRAIRNNLDGLLGLAKGTERATLAAKGDELKSSFVKVYLKRG